MSEATRKYWHLRQMIRQKKTCKQAKLLAVLITTVATAQTLEDPEPIIDWRRRQAADERLTGLAG